jgi:hypothetical protein
VCSSDLYKTLFVPSLTEFSQLALDSYRSLAKKEEYVLTGLWLETLAERHGIHPIRVRQMLNEARQAHMIERYTQGSTPETRYQKHVMHILEMDKGNPVIRSIYLYSGDFIIPGKSSVSIRIEEKE